MYALTHIAWSLALVGVAQFAPFPALVFIAGAMVDRRERRRIAIGGGRLGRDTVSVCISGTSAG
jgi:hypothetical protein